MGYPRKSQTVTATPAKPGELSILLVSVKFYAEYLEFDSANVQRSYAFLEATTPRNDVSEGRDWTLFEGRVSYPETGLNITELAKVLSKTFERRRDG